ncbi:hypothetical protein F8388_022000 [Cannabis sativa]|uniref:Uncharacterized protein n=1 Tax=Cannabis sativa TaxID=3483 RepID=A0A7J6G7E7_CANSA|nr:hypothetical protein F8388_022000 [Cannabis sativa]
MVKWLHSSKVWKVLSRGRSASLAELLVYLFEVLDTNHFALLAVLWWWLWYDRNSVLFEKKQSRLGVIDVLAKEALEEFQGVGVSCGGRVLGDSEAGEARLGAGGGGVSQGRLGRGGAGVGRARWCSPGVGEFVFPGRAARDSSSQISLSSSLSRRLRTSGSLKSSAGAGQASPMFPTGGKKRGSAAFENPEPSSPKVTCIGQVRVKTKKQSKKLRNRSKRKSGAGTGTGGGEASFRRGEKSLNETTLSSSSSCSVNHNHRNQKWVHLPLTICEALRAFSADLNCFLPCKSSCTNNSDEHNKQHGNKEKRVRSENGGGSSCGGAFARWLVSVQDGENGRRREIELVVGDDDDDDEEQEQQQRRLALPEMVRGSSQRRQVFEGIEFREEDDDDGDDDDNGDEEEEEKGRVSICIPPKNALLLMRCRSDPVKMAALSNRFWESPPKKEQEEEEVVVDDDDDEESEEELKCEEEVITTVEEVAVESDEVEVVINGDDEEEEKEEKVENFEVLLNENGDNGEGLSSGIEALMEEEELEKENEEEMEEKVEKFEALMEKPEKDSEEEEEETGKLGGESSDFYGCLSEIPEVEDDDNAVKSVLEKEEEQTLEVEEEQTLEVEEEQTLEVEEESNSEPVEEKVKEESTVQEEEEEDSPGSKPEPEPEKQEESEDKVGRKSGSGLPDCLLLMMCEPKLSMEVSKETWICSTDFIRWIPDRRPNSKKGSGLGPGPGVEEPKKRPSIVVNGGPNRGLPPIQPPRSSVSFPITAAAPQSMANVIEQKLVGSAKPYEPFVLTRCKSEPMRSTAAAKLAQEACFWKNRKLEPHHPASLGVGAAGVGF